MSLVENIVRLLTEKPNEWSIHNYVWAKTGESSTSRYIAHKSHIIIDLDRDYEVRIGDSATDAKTPVAVPLTWWELRKIKKALNYCLREKALRLLLKAEDT